MGISKIFFTQHDVLIYISVVIPFCFLLFFIIWWWFDVHTKFKYSLRILYIVIFALFKLRSSTLKNDFTPSTFSWVKRKIILDTVTRPVLNKPANNEGERDENETGANIIFYTLTWEPTDSLQRLY